MGESSVVDPTTAHVPVDDTSTARKSAARSDRVMQASVPS